MVYLQHWMLCYIPCWKNKVIRFGSACEHESARALGVFNRSQLPASIMYFHEDCARVCALNDVTFCDQLVMTHCFQCGRWNCARGGGGGSKHRAFRPILFSLEASECKQERKLEEITGRTSVSIDFFFFYLNCTPGGCVCMLLDTEWDIQVVHLKKRKIGFLYVIWPILKWFINIYFQWEGGYSITEKARILNGLLHLKLQYFLWFRNYQQRNLEQRGTLPVIERLI